MREGVHLIVYADRFGDDGIAGVRDLLTGPFREVFTGVHLLPFYVPFDGADAGFDPVDHTSVDPRLGDWDDIHRLSRTHDVTADCIINHISDRSPQFVDFLERGASSPYAGMFLDFASVFPDGATEEDLLAIYRPRPGLPFREVSLGDGSRQLMWTTFTPAQIDLDLGEAQTRAYVVGILDQLGRAGVSQVRLDAVGYAVKGPGTSCFMTADTFELIEELQDAVATRGMESLLEIHSHHSLQVETASRVDRVYDFALPPLVLHGLYTGDAVPLRHWLRMRPHNAVTVLDTHDGIGVVDVGASRLGPGLLGPKQIDRLVEGIHDATGGESREATGASASNLDLYQVNTTFYSAVGCDDDRYLLARLIQFLCPGIPQVYYAGLVAARNDMRLLEETGVGRDINRPYLHRAAIDTALDRPVVRRLMGMARFRNTHPAFAGDFTLGGEDPPNEIRITWREGQSSVEAHIDLVTTSFELRWAEDGPTETINHWDGFVST